MPRGTGCGDAVRGSWLWAAPRHPVRASTHSCSRHTVDTAAVCRVARATYGLSSQRSMVVLNSFVGLCGDVKRWVDYPSRGLFISPDLGAGSLPLSKLLRSSRSSKLASSIAIGAPGGALPTADDGVTTLGLDTTGSLSTGVLNAAPPVPALLLDAALLPAEALDGLLSPPALGGGCGGCCCCGDDDTVDAGETLTGDVDMGTAGVPPPLRCAAPLSASAASLPLRSDTLDAADTSTGEADIGTAGVAPPPLRLLASMGSPLLASSAAAALDASAGGMAANAEAWPLLLRRSPSDDASVPGPPGGCAAGGVRGGPADRASVSDAPAAKDAAAADEVPGPGAAA
mmetsp:Transcript_12592/g.36771  ORF Transcript_12592/g.36771 Transcript_12592/m.36771 type:complete len:343 (-) Transcript_12592:2256-3284(-)